MWLVLSRTQNIVKVLLLPIYAMTTTVKLIVIVLTSYIEFCKIIGNCLYLFVVTFLTEAIGIVVLCEEYLFTFRANP